MRVLPPGRCSAALVWDLAEIGFVVRYVVCASVTAEVMYCALSLMILCSDMMSTCLSRYLKLQKLSSLKTSGRSKNDENAFYVLYETMGFCKFRCSLEPNIMKPRVDRSIWKGSLQRQCLCYVFVKTK